MKVLVINAGSSSLKFTVLEMNNEKELAKGVVERIGLDEPKMEYERTEDGFEQEETVSAEDHDAALKLVCEKLVDAQAGILNDLSEVEAVGHRVVHGGEKFSESVLVTPEVKQAIDDCAQLAPLHNPPNLGGIKACENAFPGTPNVAVFDTAFHQTMPDYTYLFAIPPEYYRDYGIRKYGFHGTSHKYVANATAEYLGRPLSQLNLITCHLGNGCSVAAIRQGKVLDTSMGLTPLMGLVMGTRCGDIDPGVIFYLLKQGMSGDEIDKLLNKQSGLYGVSELGTNDMRDILQAIEDGNDKAKAAFNMFVHRLNFYIGGYYNTLHGADAVVFTGGVGENSLPTRAKVVEGLAPLGCYFDENANTTMGEQCTLSTPDSPLQAVVMPTNEELMIARDTKAILQS